MYRTGIVAAGVLLWGLLLAGCSKGERPGGDVDVPVRQAIRLSAGLSAASDAGRAATKGAINTGTTFTAAIAGWESSTEVNYGVASTWLASSEITASPSPAAIVLNPEQYYSQDGAVWTYIKAWYPAGTLSDEGLVEFGGVPDGTTDVLQAGEVSGSALDTKVLPLAFRHPLTQLKFTVQGDALFGSTTLLKSITVKEMGLPTGLNLKTDAVNYETVTLTIPGIDGKQAITPVKTLAGAPAMVRPIASKSFTIDVATSAVVYRDVLVTVTDESLKPGKAYTIALSFAGAEITAQASVAEWDDTGTGTGDVTTD